MLVGGALEHGPTTSTSTATLTKSSSNTPLPDKKLLLLILDKLQKYGPFHLFYYYTSNLDVFDFWGFNLCLFL